MMRNHRFIMAHACHRAVKQAEDIPTVSSTQEVLPYSTRVAYFTLPAEFMLLYSLPPQRFS